MSAVVKTIVHGCPLRYGHFLWGSGFLEGEEAAQVDLGVHIVGNLALVEEPVEVGLHFGAAGDVQTEGEEAPQVLLHGGQLAAVQPLLPGLLGSLVLLREPEQEKKETVTAQTTSSGDVLCQGTDAVLFYHYPCTLLSS